jgi:hypothetical protein
MGVISVRVEDRIRMMSTLLALTTWPEQEQAFKPHGVHIHCRNLRSALSAAENHPAVVILQELMESGYSLDQIFSFINAISWPGIRARSDEVPAWAPADWSVQMREFMHSFRVKDIWDKDKQAWAQAQEQAGKALDTGDPGGLLGCIFGPQDVEWHFSPNLSYPTADTIGFRSGKQLMAVCPPPVAWGNNPPWPYDDNPADTYRDAFSTYARILLTEFLEADTDSRELILANRLPVPNTFLARYPNLLDQFSVVFIGGLTSLALEQTHGKAESASYTMMTHKAHGFQILPAVVDVLNHYLAEQADGKYQTIADYLPSFFSSLKVAEKMKKS